MSLTLVAKKRSKPGPKPTPDGPREALIAMKCRPEYKDWVQRFADQNRVTPSQLLDIALVRLAAEQGFEAPPKR